MALRSGYKGYKKLAEGLKEFWPGILGVDNAALSKTFFSRSEQAVLGAVNLLENKATTQTLQGVAFTVNANKTITADNQATSTAFLQINGHVYLKAGTYYLSQGVITHDDDIRMQILKVAAGSPLIALIGGEGSEIEFTLAEDTECEVVLRIGNGKNPNGMIFKPMISLSPNQAYVPYAMTNEEITEELTTKTNVCTDTVGTVLGNSVYKNGKTVDLFLSIDGVTGEAWATIAKLPAGYRPKNNIRVVAFNRVNDALMSFQIKTDGDIKTIGALSSNNILISGSTWLTD